MNKEIDALIVLVVLTNLWMLGTSRLLTCIKISAFQGVLLALLPLLTHEGSLTLRISLQAIVSMASKGIIFPWLLTRAIRQAEVKSEMEPYVGNVASLMIGMVLLGSALWLGHHLTFPGKIPSPYFIPTALFTVMIGLFILVSRKKAITQVLGFLVMENGIYTVGLAFAEKEPLIVEMGIFLDIFMAVFVMGIMIYQINRTFDHIDTSKLTSLKD